MGVVRDITIDQLTQAVTGISATGMSDSTGQAINATLGTLGKDTSLHDIKNSIDNLAGTISPSARNVTFDNSGSPFTSSNVECALKELSIIAIEEKRFPIVYSSTSNPVSTGYYDVSKTGYTAIGVLSWAIVGTSSTITYVNACALDSSLSAPNKLYFVIRAMQQGEYNHTLFLKILYIKNS